MVLLIQEVLMGKLSDIDTCRARSVDVNDWGDMQILRSKGQILR